MTRKTLRETPLTNPTGSAIGSSQGEGPGFYQGMVGRKTGRPSPRIPIRPPRHEQILAAHGLLDPGAVDPRQGQLFSTGPRPIPREATREHDVAPPLASSRPGFMPGVYEHPEGGHRTTAEAHRQMVSGVKRLVTHEYDEPSGLPAGKAGMAGRDNPVAHAMAQRQATYDRGREQPWYATRVPSGEGRYELAPGSATEMIHAAARRQGVDPTLMTRVTALTSPRTKWTGGTPGTGDFEAPNIESAENVVRAVHEATATGQDFDPSYVGAQAPGKALGEMKSKAARMYVEGHTHTPIPISDPSSQKVPNFEQSLLLSHPVQAVRRQAAHSYTVDTHDVMAQGSHVDLLKTQSGYAISHTLGRRTALRNNELPPMSQSRIWEGQRSKTPEPLGDHSMFEQTRSEKIRPRREVLPETKTRPTVDSRSPLAKRLGLEF